MHNFSLGIGPKTLIFGHSKPYSGWSTWSPFFSEVLRKIQSVPIIERVERLGLRYINVFNHSILDKIDVRIQIADRKLLTESTNFRTEIVDGDLVQVLQVGNTVNLQINNEKSVGSVVDIDNVTNLNMPAKTFFDRYRELLEISHRKEKELFFGILTDSFLSSLDPVL